MNTNTLRIESMTESERRLINSLSPSERKEALLKSAIQKIAACEEFKRRDGEDYQDYFERVFGNLSSPA